MAHLIEVPGGEGPVNEWERRVVGLLERELPDDYTVIPNLLVAEPGGQRYEYDVVVIAPHAVYVVEVKGWQGRISGDQYEWMVNGRRRKSPMPLTEHKAKVLKSRLVDHAQVLGQVRVEAVVVMAGDRVSLQLTRQADRMVVLLRELVGLLSAPAAVGRGPGAIAALSQLVHTAILQRTTGRTRVLSFRDYQVLEVLDQSGDEALYRACRTDVPGPPEHRPEVRLRVVTLSSYLLDEAQRRERLARLYREVMALWRMGAHPNVVTAKDVFQDDDGRVVVVAEASDDRSLRQHLAEGTPLSAEQRLDVLADVCRGLEHAHANAVVHRLVTPGHVLLGGDGRARLADFGLAKLPAESTATVWQSDVVDPPDQPYLAPELRNPALGQPGPATDLYGVGLLAWELFVGEQATAPGSAGAATPPGLPHELAELVRRLLHAHPSARPAGAAEVLAVLERLRGSGAPEAPTPPKAHYEPGDIIDNRFEVRERLGSGGFRTVYRVYHPLHDCEYALKVYNTGDFHEVQREITILRGLEHPNVERVVWADQTSQGQWYLASRLVEGRPLSAHTRGGPRLSAEEVREVGDQLLAALVALHPDQRRIDELQAAERERGLSGEEREERERLGDTGVVHRDVKPANLMRGRDGVVLIDFNIASAAGDPTVTNRGTRPYTAPDAMLAGVWHPTVDLFSAGVTLYELLCGTYPYEDGVPHLSRQPADPRVHRPDLSPELAAFLLRACAPTAAERFASAVEMRHALAAVEELLVPATDADPDGIPRRLADLLAGAPPNVNPLVTEFLGLNSQARRSNRETRGLSELGRSTYVDTRLDQELTEAVLAGRHRLVIITGNAGDGKTAFIQQVEARARQRGATVTSRGDHGSTVSLGEHTLHTLYDGSEEERDRTSDDMIADFLAPFATGGTDDGAVRLAAINEGRLRGFVIAHQTRFPQLVDLLAELDGTTGSRQGSEQQVDDEWQMTGSRPLDPKQQGVAPRSLAVRDPAASRPFVTSRSPGSRPAGDAVVLVNLNLRSVTAGGPDSIFSRQLRRIVEGPFWGPCQRCDHRARCPIKHNVDTLADPNSGAEVIERLRRLVDLVRLRRRRHLTLRDVRSLSAQLLFRDRDCHEIAELLAAGEPWAVADLAYFQTIGGSLGVPPGTELERGARLLHETDVAEVANPADDRALATGNAPARMRFERRESDHPHTLVTDAYAAAGTGTDADPAQVRRAHAALRRLTFFERRDDRWLAMLPYQQLQAAERALADDGGAARLEVRAWSLHALSTWQGLHDRSGHEPALWLSTGDGEGGVRGFRHFPAEEFEVRVLRRKLPYVEFEPDRLELRHLPSGTTLPMDLDVLALLDRLRQGYVPSAEERRGLLVHVDLFLNQLRRLSSRELLLVAEDGEFRISARPGGAVELTEVTL